MSAESQRQRTTDDDQQLEHVSILAGAGARINSDEFWRGHSVSQVPVPRNVAQSGNQHENWQIRDPQAAPLVSLSFAIRTRVPRGP